MTGSGATGDAIHPLFLHPDGYADTLLIDDPAAALAADAALDTALAGSGWQAWLAHRPEAAARRRVLIVAPTLPDTEARMIGWAGTLETRHHVHVHVDPDPARGRFVKVNAAVAALGTEFDWLIVMDDDLEIGDDFADPFIDCAEAAGLVLAQPAHRITSHASYAVTQRQPRSIVRRTGFVEVGPLVAIHRSMFGALLPLAETRWSWGIDFLWADRARRDGWPIGVVDATPITHLRPAGATYSMRAAAIEATALMAPHAPVITREEMLGAGRVVIGF